MTETGRAAARRRGRPPAGASDAQREVVLDAAFALLAERGYQGTTMGAVAERAGSSKETLYAWFASKHGLFAALVRRQAEAINRAALAEPDGELAAVLLAEGRHRTGPIVEAYLARLAAEGRIRVDDPAEAFQLLYGLVVRDLQIRVLLGEAPPDRAAIAAQARTAVDRFLSLTGNPEKRLS